MGVLRKLKAKQRRRKIKRLVREHASEIIIGATVGLLTDVLADFAQGALRKRMIRRLR